MSSGNRILVYCLRISEVVMQALVFFIILLMLYAFVSTRDISIVTCLLVSVLPVFVLYIARRHVHNGVILFMIHICAAAFIYIMGSTPAEKVVHIIAGAVLIIFSVSLSVKVQKDNQEKMPIGLISVFIVAVILGNYLESHSITLAGMYCGEVYIILQVVYHNFSNVNDFIMMNRDRTTLPVKQMITVNSFIMAILATLCIGVTLLFSNSYVNKMLHSVGLLMKDAVLSVLRFFFSLLNYKEEESVITEPIEENGLTELQALAQDSASSDIINGILTIFGIVLVTLVVILIIAGLVRLIKTMGSSRSGEDVKEFILIKERKEFRIRQKKKADREKSTNAKARKIYKSIVTKNAARCGNKINDSMVPADISKLYINGDQNLATDIYEKARYSNQQVTQQEVEALKKYRKQSN